MFERYTEKARRTIFYARYEASQFGSPYIETEHLLLGLLRENKALTNLVLGAHQPVEEIRRKIESRTVRNEPTSTSVDLPLSNEGKRAMAYATEEAERLGHKHIGSEHLFLGLLREERCFAAAILREYGITLEHTRELVLQMPPDDPGYVLGGPGSGWTGARPGISQIRGIIEFRLGDKVIGSAPHLQHAPAIGEQVEIAQPLTPGKSDRYNVSGVTYEYAHEPNLPPPLALRLVKIVIQLKKADSAAQDVE